MRDYMAVGMAVALGVLTAWVVDQVVGPKEALHSRQERVVRQLEPPAPVAHEIKTSVQLQKITEPSPSPAPPASPPPQQTRSQRPLVLQEIRATPALLQQGVMMLGPRGERLGAFPAIIAQYRRTLGFRRYAVAMQALGGRFVLWDRRARTLAFELDPITGRVYPVDTTRLRGLSPRSRDVSDEPALRPSIERVQQVGHNAHHAALVLVPLAVDYAMLAGLKQALQATGLSLQAFTTFHGVYTLREGDLLLTITSGTTRRGQEVQLRISCNLSALARG
jgi:hypothetical protein